jgi:hypothetical protein
MIWTMALFCWKVMTSCTSWRQSRRLEGKLRPNKLTLSNLLVFVLCFGSVVVLWYCLAIASQRCIEVRQQGYLSFGVPQHRV